MSSTPTDASSSVFELNVDDAPHSLAAVSFRGRERLSKTYTFDISARGVQLTPETLEASYVGRAAHFRFAGAGGTERWVHGVVRLMTASGDAGDADDSQSYRLQLVPLVRLLAEKRNSRIFQDRTTAEIVETVLGGAGITLRMLLTDGMGRRPYCVQHQETDLAFVERLLAEEGAFYWFDHPQSSTGSEVMVVGHAATDCKAVPGEGSFRVKRGDGMAIVGDRGLSSFRLTHRVRPGSVVLRGFDFQRPSFDLRSEATASTSADPWTGEPPEPTAAAPRAPTKTQGAPASGAATPASGHLDVGTIEQYHHDFGELEVTAASAASGHLDQHRRKLWIAEGEGHTVSLAAGFTIDVEDAQFDTRARSYTLIEVRHEGVDPQRTPLEAGQRESYRNRFRCVPLHAPLRPRLPAPRLQQVMETATVVGPPGHDIHTDQQGRVKVRFHWDREGVDSCWLRVLQPLAGAGWGFQFIPRVGMEVMVVFLAGDADRPMVVGTVYNAEHPTPFPLPADQTKSGIRTRSTPGGDGYNEISFQDKAGQEVVVLRAQRDLNETINQDHTTKIGGDRTLTVDRTYTAAVGGDATSAIEGNKREVVQKDRSEAVAGNASISVRGNEDVHVRGNRLVTVEGSTRHHALGSATVEVDRETSLTTTGGLSVNVGAAEEASGVLHAKGNWVIGADGSVLVTALGDITFQCGESRIRLTPDLVEISGKTVAVKGTERSTNEGGQSQIELAEEAKIASKATRLFGAASSMELTSNAYLKGTQIKLNFREGDPPKPEAGAETKETRPLSLRLTDGGFQDFPNRPYELTIDGIRYSGTTDASGAVTQEIPADALKANLLLWEGDPPAGKRHSWDLLLQRPAPATTVEGARSRLANLGYEVGAGARLDERTKGALLDFQEDHQLDTTGELDAVTTSKLSEVQGY